MKTLAELNALLAAAEEAVHVAARDGHGYEATQEARQALKAIEAEIAAASPKARVYIVGNTYNHRTALKRMGLVWDAGHHAWTGMMTGAEIAGLPAGCRAVSKAEAGLASMDYADSAY